MKLAVFNDWVLDKILEYLVYNENCITETQYNTAKTTKAIIMDSIGNRYEITVKAITRPGVENEFSNKIDFMVFPETPSRSKHE